MNKLSDGTIITGYYGKDGAMSEGWDNEQDAIIEFEQFYQDSEYDGCEVIQYNGKWVIAY